VGEMLRDQQAQVEVLGRDMMCDKSSDGRLNPHFIGPPLRNLSDPNLLSSVSLTKCTNANLRLV
jgi:hypothetical protein